MYNIKLTIKIKAAPNVVYGVLKNMNKFPQIMHYVKDIKIEKVNTNKFITVWFLDVEGADVTWEEEDFFDEKNKIVKFSMIEGDYGKYFGIWKAEPFNKESILKLDINVDWDIPSFEKIIGPILESKTKRILRGMMAAIKLEAQRINKETLKR